MKKPIPRLRVTRNDAGVAGIEDLDEDLDEEWRRETGRFLTRMDLSDLALEDMDAALEQCGPVSTGRPNMFRAYCGVEGRGKHSTHSAKCHQWPESLPEMPGRWWTCK